VNQLVWNNEGTPVVVKPVPTETSSVFRKYVTAQGKIFQENAKTSRSPASDRPLLRTADERFQREPLIERK
jgi:hypothetical protein